MKILVTGGAGFIGTNLIKRLVAEGHEVISYDNYSTGLYANHIEGATYIDVDIRTLGRKSKYYLNKFDVVFHLAAMARIQPSFDQPEDYFDTNASATMKLAKICVDSNIPMIYAGSSSHHSGKFKNPYTFSKDIGEEIIKLFQQQYGLRASVARFYNVYGPHHLKQGGYCTLLGAWERCLESGEQVVIYGDGSKRRDFTHVDDIVDALIRICMQNAWGYEFELGRSKNYSVLDIAKMYGIDNIEYRPDNPGEAQDTLCTDMTAHQVLGWEPTLKIEDYIKGYNENFNNSAKQKQFKVS
jgi:UDP-glucose 4-epimerase